MFRTLQAAMLGMLLAVSVATGQQRSTVKQVLVLQSVNRGNLTLDRFTGVFRIGLDQHVASPVNFVQVVVGPTGFVGARASVIVHYIQSLYADRAPPDLVVTVGGPAALFARNHRQQLFPATPLLFGAMDQRYLRDSPLGENETAVAVVNDLPALIDDILRVLPETRQIFMVTGSGAIGRFMRPELETGFARFQGRVSFIWSDQMSFSEILQRVARLPPHSAIVHQTFGSEAEGTAYPAEEVIASLHARANAPLFSAQSAYLGRGVVGGFMMNIDDLGRRTAEVGGRILNGELPARLRVPPQSLARLLAYDYDVVGAVANGRALLEAAHQLQPDIIVLDLSFTDVDSLEACSLITQRDPRIKVIVFTGREDAAVWHRALEAGAVAVVSKLVGGDLLSELERLRHDEG